MIKKMVTSVILGGAVLGMVASANAETINVNIYGASAQYTYWTNAAAAFLTDQGCATTVQVAKDGSDKHGIAYCSDLNGDEVYLRYSSKASYDGIRSVQGLDPDNVSSCPSDGEREMANELDTTWGTQASPGTVNSLTCKDVTVGASDVAAETFKQSSNGALLGPAGGDYETRNISGLTMDPTYQVDRPVVVPFAFFRNANSTINTVPFDNMSRLMATSLFNGQVTDWQQFDPSVPSVPVIICMRHAGSGTHATLDAGVMRGDYSLMDTEALPGSFPVFMNLQPVTYFNDGSSDEMRCVGGGSIDNYDGIGAVGYADSDKVVMDPSTGEYHASKYGDVKLMTYMGEEAIKRNIVNGKYDFWSAQWLYSNETGATKALIDALVVFASDPSNLPGSKADYWASQTEMNVEKSSDYTWPKFK